MKRFSCLALDTFSNRPCLYFASSSATGCVGVAGHGAGGSLRLGRRLGAQVADRVQDREAGHRRVRRRGGGAVP
jgi:hypothetical protein